MPAPTNALAPQSSNALMNFYRENVSLPTRTYGESLLKSFLGNTKNPITNADIRPQEQASLDALVKENYAQKLAQFKRPKADLLQNAKDLEMAAKQELDYAAHGGASEARKEQANKWARHWTTQAKQLRDAAAGNLPTNFAFNYPNYGDRTGKNTYTNDPEKWAQTLGRFRYEVDPKTGEYRAYDSYDFDNEAHKFNAQRYAEMSAPSRMINALSDTVLRRNQYALGEAYLAGENSVPVSIKGKLK